MGYEFYNGRSEKCCTRSRSTELCNPEETNPGSRSHHRGSLWTPGVWLQVRQESRQGAIGSLGSARLVTVGCRWLPMSWAPGLWQMSSRKGYSKGNCAHSHWSLSCGGGDHPMGPGVEIELGLVPPIEKVNDSADQRIGNPTTGCGAHWLNVVDPEVSHSRLSC